MLFHEFIRLAGGVKNVLRVLLPHNQVALCINDVTLVSNDLPLGVTLEKVLDETHLVSSGSVEPTPVDLLNLGKEIDTNLREKASLCFKQKASAYRPGWHVSPPQGLLNDPNGFIFHQGKYYLCFQWYPFECIHKDKYWVQMSSDDLINWNRESIALTPSDWFDSHGVYSGHAVSREDGIMVFYTGNTRIGDDRIRQTTQCAAITKDGKHYDKLGPLIPQIPLGVTEHIRDPKVIFHEDKWWMFLGAQTTDLKGRLAIYTSSDLLEWDYKGLFGQELGDYGYMWECPDVFKLDGQYYLAFSPQGIEPDSSYNTLPHQNRIAPIEFTNKGGITIGQPVTLDYGFDFYAFQSTETSDSRRVMIGWMGLPDEVNQPSCDDGWIHQFSLPRVLCMENGILKQQPCVELERLRGEKIDFPCIAGTHELKTKQFDLSLKLKAGGEIQLFADDTFHTTLRYEPDEHRLVWERANTELRESDTTREAPAAGDWVELRILADNSSLEIFINDGEAVMTGRVFTPATATRLILDNQVIDVSGYYLSDSQLPFANQ
ncbi:glycoside hydrolase family 32 protein [Vibrio viridaestus]|uniref:Sucrose-6-phosphate hydrolase n=1 Tax=Vibrio viridaestus TaxID=2487322 RepID=A0A3N9TM85_9VIBR|nr:glycoside hydrolase family 32 protein [Vibrio viridaestus]RQW65114.1 glycoside hydrolase family 32 protein [Vibrio viridaestus]